MRGRRRSRRAAGRSPRSLRRARAGRSYSASLGRAVVAGTDRRELLFNAEEWERDQASRKPEFRSHALPRTSPARSRGGEGGTLSHYYDYSEAPMAPVQALQRNLDA